MGVLYNAGIRVRIALVSRKLIVPIIRLCPLPVEEQPWFKEGDNVIALSLAIWFICTITYFGFFLCLDEVRAFVRPHCGTKSHAKLCPFLRHPHLLCIRG